MARRRIRAVLGRRAAVLLSLLALAVTTLVAQPAGAQPAGQSDVARSRPPIHARSAYVALGDSYASGEGLPPFAPGTGGAGGCHRSLDQSYPAVLADSGRRSFARLTSVACSGAVTSDLVATRPGTTRPPQLDALDSRTRTITLTIGGNDAGFALVFGDCVYSPDPGLQAALPGGGPGCAARDDALVSKRIAALSGGPGAPSVTGIVPLPVLLDQIDAVAPRATIYLTGYPSLFGKKTTDAAGCRVNSAAPLYVAASDAAWIRSKTAHLDKTIRSTAAAARAQGVDVRYVDVARTFRGHNLCDRRTSWVNGVVLASVDPLQLSPATLHPTARGQRAYARSVLRTADHRHPCHRKVTPRP